MTYTFPERLKELRTEKKLSTRELATAVGCSHIAISRWERNVKKPNVDNLIALCKFFNVSADYLLGLED